MVGLYELNETADTDLSRWENELDMRGACISNDELIQHLEKAPAGAFKSELFRFATQRALRNSLRA